MWKVKVDECTDGEDYIDGGYMLPQTGVGNSLQQWTRY